MNPKKTIIRKINKIAQSAKQTLTLTEDLKAYCDKDGKPIIAICGKKGAK